MALTYTSGHSDDLPSHARPDAYLAALTATPAHWVTVIGESLEGTYDWGVRSYLTCPENLSQSLDEDAWDDYTLGAVAISTDREGNTTFEGGLSDPDGAAEFFAQYRTHHQLAESSLEFTPSFLWYFDAIPGGSSSWTYLDAAGRDHPLVRVQRTDTELRVEVAASPLRRYLAVRQRVLVTQHDKITRLEDVPEPEITATDRTPLRHFTFRSGDISAVERPGFVRLLGKQAVIPFDLPPADLARPHPSQEVFPAFTIGTDPATGQPVAATCDPDLLSTYFEDRGTPHYLTRVYFRREVLGRYHAEPSRYRFEHGRLSCLHLWGVSIGRTSDGLVEAYLGDLGRDLPSEERHHWLSFNTLPPGGRDEVRFRRDILGQWADDASDPLRDLFTSRARFEASLTRLLRRAVYRPWHREDQIAFEGLHHPISREQSEADTLLLTLAKGIVDGLDVKALRKLPGVTDAKAASLNCLDAWVTSTGADPDTLIAPLRLLQSLRSTGSAHLRSKDWQAHLTRAGLEQLAPDEQFSEVLRRTAQALDGLAEHADSQSAPSTP